MEGKSLNLFSINSNFRGKVYRIIHSKKFDIFIVLTILFSSVELALENPLSDPNGNLSHTLLYLEALTMIIFCLEAILKTITFGFFFNGNGSYLRNKWNAMDFFIIILSVILFSSTFL